MTKRKAIQGVSQNSIKNFNDSTYIDLLEVDLFLEHSGFGLFPDFLAEGDVGALDDVAPEAASHYVISSFFLRKNE